MSSLQKKENSHTVSIYPCYTCYKCESRLDLYVYIDLINLFLKLVIRNIHKESLRMGAKTHNLVVKYRHHLENPNQHIGLTETNLHKPSLDLHNQ